MDYNDGYLLPTDDYGGPQGQNTSQNPKTSQNPGHFPESKTLPRIQKTLSRIKKHFPESKTLHALQHLPESKTLPRIQSNFQNTKHFPESKNTFHTTKNFPEHWLHKLKIRGVRDSLCTKRIVWENHIS